MHMQNSWGARQKELAEAGWRKPTYDEQALIEEARNQINLRKGRSDKNDPMAHLPAGSSEEEKQESSPMSADANNSAAAAHIAEDLEELNVDHEMQKLRQDYMTDLLERILSKKSQMHE